MARIRPSVFIGSSSKEKKVAGALQVLLDPTCEVTIWSQGVFGLSQGNLESLVNALDKFDFALLVLTADDLVTSGENSSPAPRDNVLFELGLFMGGLGRDRTFIVYDRTIRLRLPTDLAGVAAATFEPHTNGSLQAALGAAATTVQDVIDRLGVRDKERFKRLSKAAEELDSTAGQMQKLIKLIARSRKVELEIISAQFGSLIDPSKLNEIKRDLADLDEIL